MSRYLLLSIAASLILAPMTALSAQHPAPRGIREVSGHSPGRFRDGLWLSLSLGAGQESYRYHGDPAGYNPEVTGPTFSLKMGGTPSQHWTLGGEAFGWAYHYQGGTETLTSLMVIAQWYPDAQGGFFIKGGAGVTGSFFDQNAGPGLVLSSREGGVGAVVGAGYEFRIGRNISLAPTWTCIISSTTGAILPSES